MKRAQILVADVWACFDGCGLGEFTDIDDVTMFADYRVPQALLYCGCLEYSPSLLRRLESKQIVASGDGDEVAIRGCSIWAVELVKREIIRRLKEEENGESSSIHVNAILIDFYLWDFAKREADVVRAFPIHLTRGVFY